MPRTPDHASRSANHAPVGDKSTVTNLTVRGALPAGLSGQYLLIEPNSIEAPSHPEVAATGESMVHVVTVFAGQSASYRNRRIKSDATNIITFGRSILVFGDDALASELGPDLDSTQSVDLAGARRTLTARPKVDSITGQLHLLTFTRDPSQLHISVSPGGLTRTTRAIDNAPNMIRQLELTGDCIVLLADGFVGVADRTGARTTTDWVPIDTAAHDLAAAHLQGDTVVVHATGPSLVQWTMQRRATTAHFRVLDATPHEFATSNSGRGEVTLRFLWTVGSGAVHKHDLLTGSRQSHEFGRGRHPGAHIFVGDPDRDNAEDGGWLIGIVHDETGHETSFVVLDAHAIERPALAVVQLPRHIRNSARGTWAPTLQI